MFRDGMAALIGGQPDMLLAGQAASGREALQQYRQCQPDVTLLDLRLPDMSGIETLRAIRAEFPQACVVILTTFEDEIETSRALAAGARGYLLKTLPPDQLLDTIRKIYEEQQK